jgi:hypothetical protein
MHDHECPRCNENHYSYDTKVCLACGNDSEINAESFMKWFFGTAFIIALLLVILEKCSG